VPKIPSKCLELDVATTSLGVPHCDVVTINAPLHPETIVEGLESGQLAGYAGDVWFPQPPPNDHPWRAMPHHGMTPHISGSSLSAQARYAAGTREILECCLENWPIRDEYLIVDRGRLAGTGAHSYSAGNATSGAEDARHFQT
jgi:formate dehydrogenase